MMLIIYIITSLFSGIAIGIAINRKRTADYKQRWIEARKLWESERDGTSQLTTNNGSHPDYHTLDGPNRYAIALARYNKNLPIEDDLEKWEPYKWYRDDELVKLRLKQERESEKK